jgi:nucleoid DNA-binding protein
MTLKHTAQAILAKTAKSWKEEKEASRLITATLKNLGSVIAEDLAKTGKAELPGIGMLRLHALPERPARHPITGDKIKVPGKRGIEFVADRKLKAAV